ncbi:MAG: murein biosynthesis integral membrane protein MurJ [Gammaproteobacteria bacterium]|nr:murein biosynthesis integral membrane protein MurJ [Gammaproteobacteria bacterium]
MSDSLIKSTATVGGMTLISRVLGFVRDVVLARVFGAGLGMDAFFVAFKIPSFLRRLFAEGAFSQAFVPVLSEYKTRHGEAPLRELVDHVAGTLGGVLLLVTIAGTLAAPLLVLVFAPGFVHTPDKYALTARMLHVTFPYLLFISLTAFSAGILNSHGRFGVPALTPVLLNLCLIGAALLLAPYFHPPVVALAWGVFAAGVVQLLFQLPFLHRLRLLPRPRWGWRHPGVQRILRLMLPAIFGSSVAQINLLIDTLIASFLVTGSVSWLYYSDRLMEFPLGVFGIALGTVILPSLSRQHAQAAPERFIQTLDVALRWVALIGLPAALGLMLLAGPMLATLFHYGAFSAYDVHMASRSLMAFAFGLPGFILVKVLAPAYYARQDTRTPVRIGVIAMLSNIAFNLLLVVPLAHAGIALATSLAAFLNGALLLRALRRSDIYRPLAGWRPFLLRVAAANAVMTALLWLGSERLAVWLRWDAAQRALHLAGWILAAGIVYFVSLWVLGLRLKQLRRV